MLSARANREITPKRRPTGVMGVILIIIVIVILYVPSVGGSTWECIDWEQMLATSVARKATMQGIAP